ncbi:MAG: 2-amino-4-hydroxy-6-hydroxymethyldihydropteridine diphosphokinase [Dehalococcoidales bacterium]|jgi:2-amino-4-hydroxy-6-hydroxymethyldihydropteridine diphosphokinase|nr:2-amino-4-hydroxy-6-hydroxymethyldihydropteridine diphosphokinase [Dehalococcoidales bacterium]
MAAMEYKTVYLGLGSNLGDRKDNLEKAIDYLSQRIRITMRSSIYDTEAMENREQPRFLNMVCQAKTIVKPQDLLVLAKAVERKMGRQPSSHNAPRTIDIDILLYGDEVIDTPELTVPHSSLPNRAFALVPLAEIVPNLVHPVSKKTVDSMLKDLDQGIQGIMKINCD